MPHDVLVVEDQPGWAALVRNALRNGHVPACNLHTAANYEDALALVEKGGFRLALLDYMLGPSPAGARTGLDVADALRKRGSDATIFLITMVDPERVEARCKALGVTLIEKGRADIEEEIIREVRDALA
jgi:CheY-like chemotaxis protein